MGQKTPYSDYVPRAATQMRWVERNALRLRIARAPRCAGCGGADLGLGLAEVDGQSYCTPCAFRARSRPSPE